jgi:hypothetical protein
MLRRSLPLRSRVRAGSSKLLKIRSLRSGEGVYFEPVRKIRCGYHVARVLGNRTFVEVPTDLRKRPGLPFIAECGSAVGWIMRGLQIRNSKLGNR